MKVKAICLPENENRGIQCKISKNKGVIGCGIQKMPFLTKTYRSLIGSQLAKLKRVFLSYYCHEIYRIDVADLKNPIILEKFKFL